MDPNINISCIFFPIETSFVNLDREIVSDETVKLQWRNNAQKMFVM